MSLLPFVSSGLFLAVLVSVFFWKSQILTIFLILSYFISVFYLEEVDSLGISSRIPGSFAIFIFSEAVVFVSILLAVAWYNSFESLNLTFWNELPVIGTAILFVSSVSVAAYHHSMGSPVGLFNLKLTFWLGMSFVVLQYSEFRECCVCLVDSGYSSSSLCAVGLHLLHVFVGVLSLGFLIKYVASAVSAYRPSLVVWYWHFVDYVWLVVYFLVYVL
uniref:Cytochrome c oxidase subunit 3 n=1 Tax=Dicrocoelium dendriticum TaxID=57078 RepID=A0A096XCC5_DICDE|nr:cytochrome c oxidase subunit 3 [Dicrocoelium dendriticum]AHG06508.1 cytochrome c oxidase subunit 3 [Dicrocoelium dendriticum]